MKKILALLMTLILSLVAFSGSALAANAGRVEDAEEETVEAIKVLGTKEENTYTNEYLGLTATFAEDWYVLSNEETAEAMGLVLDMADDEVLAAQLENSGTLCDLYTIALDGSNDSVNIQIEDLGLLYGLVISEDKYYEMAVSTLADALGSFGFANVTLNKEVIDFADEEHVSCVLSGEINDMTVYERIVLVKAGNYMLNITASSFISAEKADSYLALFEAIEDAEKAA